MQLSNSKPQNFSYLVTQRKQLVPTILCQRLNAFYYRNTHIKHLFGIHFDLYHTDLQLKQKTRKIIMHSLLHLPNFSKLRTFSLVTRELAFKMEYYTVIISQGNWK